MLAKIESADSVEHLEEILNAADGAMVARGDLGAELPLEEVPYWQNLIVQVGAILISNHGSLISNHGDHGDSQASAGAGPTLARVAGEEQPCPSLAD